MADSITDFLERDPVAALLFEGYCLIVQVHRAQGQPWSGVKAIVEGENPAFKTDAYFQRLFPYALHYIQQLEEEEK